MKRIICLILCVVFCTFALVSCDDWTPGEDLWRYDGLLEEERPEMTLNVYIVTDEATTDNAIVTVERMISQYTKNKFTTSINMHYYTADEYVEALNAGVASTSDSEKADIVLINSYELFHSLQSDGKLADLSAYLNTTTFGSLNTQIATSLLGAALVDSSLYAIPNNRVIGEYKYLVIDRTVAEKQLNFSMQLLTSYKSLDDAQELCEALADAGYEPGDYIYETTGGYELKAELEANSQHVCNVIQYPTVDIEYVFESAFAVIQRDDARTERAMEIIYAINTDTYLRNLLQYGVEGTNYTLDVNGHVVRVGTENNNAYYMDLLYTGDVFKALYCDALLWNESVSANGSSQNKEAVIAE